MARRSQDGPDACLHVPGWGWILIAAPFGGGADTLADAAATEAWLEQLLVARTRPLRRRRAPAGAGQGPPAPHAPDDRVRPSASRPRAAEQAVVVALVRASESADLERWVGRCLADTADVAFRRVTWESLYAALDPDDEVLAPLREYLENKSYGLRPAFALHEADDEGG